MQKPANHIELSSINHQLILKMGLVSVQWCCLGSSSTGKPWRALISSGCKYIALDTFSGYQGFKVCSRVIMFLMSIKNTVWIMNNFSMLPEILKYKSIFLH